MKNKKDLVRKKAVTDLKIKELEEYIKDCKIDINFFISNIIYRIKSLKVFFKEIEIGLTEIELSQKDIAKLRGAK